MKRTRLVYRARGSTAISRHEARLRLVRRVYTRSMREFAASQRASDERERTRTTESVQRFCAVLPDESLSRALFFLPLLLLFLHRMSVPFGFHNKEQSYLSRRSFHRDLLFAEQRRRITYWSNACLARTAAVALVSGHFSRLTTLLSSRAREIPIRLGFTFLHRRRVDSTGDSLTHSVRPSVR